MTYRFHALFIAIGSLFQAAPEAQQPSPQQAVAIGSEAARPVAPPPVREIPSGSASTSPDERRTMEAMRMAPDERIVLDGRLDEDVWMRAVPATNFIQTDPDNGQPATEQTEVRIVDSFLLTTSCSGRSIPLMTVAPPIGGR